MSPCIKRSIRVHIALLPVRPVPGWKYAVRRIGSRAGFLGDQTTPYLSSAATFVVRYRLLPGCRQQSSGYLNLDVGHMVHKKRSYEALGTLHDKTVAG